MALLEQGVALSPRAGDPGFPWGPPFRAEAAALHPPDSFAVAAEAARRLGEALRGIEAWQAHPHARRMPLPPVIWQAGAARLLDFGGRGPAVLVIPSLINRSSVLDLAPDASLMRFLAASGRRALLIDWGDPGVEECGFGFAGILRRRLLPALAAAEAAAGPVALAGYCMGGTLAAALAQEAAVARLALIGAPWDFSAPAGTVATVRGLAREYGGHRLTAMLEGLAGMFGLVPGAVFQQLFAALDPGLALAKFRRFASLDPGSRAARFFVELEDWLNDPVALPGPVAVELLVGWHLDNLTGRGLWCPGSAPVRPERLRLPVLAFCAVTDRIAPPASTEALARAIPGARILRPASGHVGMIVGRRARAEVWEPLRDFLAAGAA